MTASRYCIGIDLGTSNCAVSYIDTRSDSPTTQVLIIPQYHDLDSVQQRDVLPSFLYFLTEDESRHLEQSEDTAAWSLRHIVGECARDRALTQPERVVHSAKSWLCHDDVDREAALLPWASSEIELSEKLSPVAVSAAYLDYIRQVWNRTIAAGEHSAKFERQDIAITVPASFDSVAQRLTLKAAELAGYPAQVRLLEEPQAAFYAWLERTAQGEPLRSVFPELATRPHTVLVCDIGGGTSDFSLFEVQLADAERDVENAVPQIKRITVSDHILLGGDNLDQALAHTVAERLGGLTEGTAGTLQLQQLVGQCRQLKERVLGNLAEGGSATTAADFHFSVAGTGSQLFGGARSVSLTQTEVMACLLEGFFGDCSPDSEPRIPAEGLRELGLPYARDPRVFAHLAAFLKGRPIDAVLLNGGTFESPRIRQRILTQLQNWQESPVAQLENPQLHLAVARGAAWYLGQLRIAAGVNIGGGAAHAVYLEVESSVKKNKPNKGTAEQPPPKSLVCILPQGTELDTPVRVTQLNLKLKVNAPARFQAYESNTRPDDRAGQVLRQHTQHFHALPPLQTIALLPPGTQSPKDGYVDVQLEASLNAVGLLQVSCVSVRRLGGDAPARFELEFNLRAKPFSPTATDSDGSGSAAEKQTPSTETAQTVLDALYCDPARSAEAGALLKQWETALGTPRKQWDTPLLRELWSLLAEHLTHRHLSVAHELGWLIAAGFVLRPGYGYPFDEARIRQLWFLHELGLAHPQDKGVREQGYILWRRTAGGLSREQQTELFEGVRMLVESDTKASAEAIRMVGAFERLPMEIKRSLRDRLLEQIMAKPTANREAHLWALGRLLSRHPLYGGQSAVTPPEWVVAAYDALETLDWSAGNLAPGLIHLFTQSCRVVDHREHDVPKTVREAIAARLTATGINETRLYSLHHYVPLATADLQQLFGESLPTGLRLEGR